MPDKAAGPTLLQRAVMWILHAAMFYVVALYPVYLMARFEPDDIVHYGFLRWMAVVLVLYWAASQLLFTERPSETRPGRMLLAVTAAVVLIIGVFSPIVSFSFIGDVDYFREGYGDGYILLIMALLSLALAVTGRWKQVLIPALGSLAAILWTFLGVQDTITQARTGGASELTGNPHEGLAAAVMQSIQWEWGWVLLFAGSGLLVYSATRKDQWESASPPLVSVAVDDEPETVAAEATAETEAEIEPAETAAAAPAADAAPASAESAGATEPAEPTAEAPAEQAEAARASAEQAEETTAARPEAPEPAAEETAAPARGGGAEEQKADETAAQAPAPQPEPQPAEPAAEPDPQQPEAASAETAAATSADEAEAAAETAPEEKAPATTEPATVAKTAPASTGAPAEAVAEEKSASAPAEEKSESAPADAK